MQYHVMSLRPGMHRGGHANPQHKEYLPGDHTTAQFRDLLNDPNFVVITGGERMTLDHVAAMEAVAEAEAANAAKAEAEAAISDGTASAEREAEVTKAEGKIAATQAAKTKKA